MTRIHHLNCGYLQVPPNPRVGCHCLLLEDRSGFALIDTGIGLLDVQRPSERIGQAAIDMAGFQFVEGDTALRQIERLGLQASDIRHVVLTHGDPDHAGGLADFPEATVHIGAEELANLSGKSPRYRPIQFEHQPRWKQYEKTTRDWFGLEARPLSLGFESDVFLVPLFGHTLGHAGVAIQQGKRWVFHVGDAYYLRLELRTDDHWVSQVAAQRADDDAQRRASLEDLRRLNRDHSTEIEMFGYHDLGEWRGEFQPTPVVRDRLLGQPIPSGF